MNEIIEFKQARKSYLAFFCAINFCTGGLYVWSILSVAIAAKLSAVTGVSVLSSDLAPIFGLASGLTPFMMLAGGFVNDHFGPRWVIAGGGAALAIGYCLSGVMASEETLYITYGVLVGVGTGLVNGCTINTAVKYFPERRGFAGGLVTASLGIGAAVLPFAARFLIDAFGIDATLFAFGIFSAVVILPLAFLTKSAPNELIEMLAKETPSPAAASDHSLTPWEMLRSATFFPLAFLFMTSATLGLMILSNVSGIAQAQVGLTATAAAAAVAVISLANTAGRFISGTLSDALGRVPTLCATLCCALVGLYLLMLAGEGDQALFFGGLIGIGICFGAFIGIYPSLVADEYGTKHNSVNFSILMLGYSVGGIVGPYLIKSAGAEGSFAGVYKLAAVVCLFGFVCAAIYLLIKRRARHQDLLEQKAHHRAV